MEPTFIVDQLLPCKEIHLVAGPTGVGKTRWLLETLKTWQQGKPVLGYRSYPVPWLYVAADRTEEGTQRTIDQLALSDSVPLLAAWDRALGITGIIDHSVEVGAKLLVIESFGSFTTGGSSHIVKCFLQAISHLLRNHHLTIIGIVEQPKMRPGNRYQNPRQRVSGPAAWGHHTETIFLVEFEDEKDPTHPGRWLYVCPRNAPSLKIRARMEKGNFLLQYPERVGFLNDLCQ